MGTVRKLAAVVACTACLGVTSAAAAAAQTPAVCDRVAKITERIEAKQARIAARDAGRVRPANGRQRHKADLTAKLQAKISKLETRCSG